MENNEKVFRGYLKYFHSVLWLRFLAYPVFLWGMTRRDAAAEEWFLIIALIIIMEIAAADFRNCRPTYPFSLLTAAFPEKDHAVFYSTTSAIVVLVVLLGILTLSFL